MNNKYSSSLCLVQLGTSPKKKKKKKSFWEQKDEMDEALREQGSKGISL